MKTLTVLVLVTFSGSIWAADDFAKMSREDRCKSAGGLVAGHGAPKPSKKENPLVGPIDCTCGGKRFNPLQKGDVCRDGKILTAFEHNCVDSKGELRESKNLEDSDKKTKFPHFLRKCLCGTEDFMPTDTTLCSDGKVAPDGRK